MASIADQFHKDLTAMVRIAYQLDKFYEKSRNEINQYLEKFILLTAVFNQKYPLISFKVSQQIDHINTKLLLAEESFQKVYEEAASLGGLQNVSSKGFSREPNPEAHAGQIEKAKDELYLTFLDDSTGFGSIYLRFDSSDKKIELVYDPETIVNKPSPEFKLALKYAEKESNMDVRLENEAATYGFTDWLANYERSKHHEKFDPHFSE